MALAECAGGGGGWVKLYPSVALRVSEKTRPKFVIRFDRCSKRRACSQAISCGNFHTTVPRSSGSESTVGCILNECPLYFSTINHGQVLQIVKITNWNITKHIAKHIPNNKCSFSEVTWLRQLASVTNIAIPQILHFFFFFYNLYPSLYNSNNLRLLFLYSLELQPFKVH